MRLNLLLSTCLLVGAGAGCRNTARRVPPQPTIPTASEVASVQLKSIGSSLNHVYDVTLTKETDIEALVDWLKKIDWSPSRANDLSGVGLAEVGQITFKMKVGNTHSFGLSGGSIIVNRWEWRANTDVLADIAKQAGAKVQ
jgi:hypothetical protein